MSAEGQYWPGSMAISPEMFIALVLRVEALERKLAVTITVGAVAPTNPSVGDLWVDTTL